MTLTEFHMILMFEIHVEGRTEWMYVHFFVKVCYITCEYLAASIILKILLGTCLKQNTLLTP
jgi:hypothetical protein